MKPAVPALFLLSGASSLVYQVAWVRLLGLVYGNTVQSAAMVTAVFLGGLGLGAWAGGRWIDREPTRGLWGYGVAELAIGALGAALALLLPHLPGLGLPPIPTTTVLLLPSTLSMGATLTLLVRHLTAAADDVGFQVGVLYGANTLGAALGALATDLVAVPALGLFGTQLAAAGLNVAAGLGALRLARSLPAAAAATPEQTASWPWGPAAALGLAGFAAMGFELVWLRFLAGALGPYRGVLSVLLATVLVGLALGAAGAGLALRRGARPAVAFAVAQAVVAVTALGGLAWFDPEDVLRRQLAVAPAFLDGGPWLRSWLVHRVNASTIVGLVLVPAIAMGAAFPLGNALAHDALARVGRRTGQLYLATTVGNVLGSLATGFLLLPGLGLQATTLLLGAVSWLAAAVLGPRGSVAWTSLGLAGAALAAFTTLPSDHLLWRTFPANRAQEEGVLAVREGLEQVIVVTGDLEGPVRLWTSGHPMTSTSPHAQRYMRLMAHLPLLLHPEARRVLVIAFGAGNTTHAASLHPIRELHVADLSRDVLELAPLFAHSNRNVLLDPRVTPFVDDGRHHLWRQPEGAYDLITLEPPPLATAGVSSLYAEEFYALARSRLSSTGSLAQWLPAYQVPDQDVRSLVRAFVDVFPDAVLLIGSGRELVLLGSVDPRPFDPDAVEALLAERPEVAADLARIGLGTPRELALTFGADAQTLQRVSSQSRPLTDDHPMLESAQASHLQQTTLPPDLLAPGRIGAWCPRCGDDAELMRWIAVSDRAVHSPAYGAFRSVGGDSTSTVPAPDASDATLAAIAHSETLRRSLWAPDALGLRAAELWGEGEHDEARAHLDAARFQVPDLPLFEELATTWADD